MRNLIVLIFIMLFLHTFHAQEDEDQQPNIVFILVDDLGKEWISCYGASEIKTPNIDRLAETGIKFHRAYSMPQCTPSRVTLLTGQYPFINGWINHFDVPRWGHGARFDPQLNPVFVKELKKAGYRTCAAGKWQINDFRIEPDAMVKAGFDDYCMWTGGEGGNEEISDKRYWDPYIHTKEGSKTYVGQFGPDIYSNFIIDFISKKDNRPFFAYYPMTLTHTPFVHTPLSPEAKTNYEKHLAMVEYTDFIVGKIMQVIDEKGYRENTYIFFTTDNGTTPAIIGKRNEAYVRGGKTYLTENGINAPFIVQTPLSHSGAESNALIDFTDIFPTVLNLAGIDLQESDKIDGSSFAPLLLRPTEHGKRNWIASLGSHPAVLDTTGKMKNYHIFRDRIICSDKYKAYVDTTGRINRLYDIIKDPYEQTNLHGNQKHRSDLTHFEIILEQMPAQDQQPNYVKSDTSYYNEPKERLYFKSQKAHLRGVNMSPVAKKEDFLSQLK